MRTTRYRSRDALNKIVSRLQIFIQIHIFQNIVKKYSLVKKLFYAVEYIYYNEYCNKHVFLIKSELRNTIDHYSLFLSSLCSFFFFLL